MTAHPDLASLERHAAEPSAEVAAHLAGCPACRATSATLREQAALAAELRAAVTRGVPREAAPVAPRIEGYEDFRLVSTGGQGVVWRARQTATRRDVALKLLVGAAYAGPRMRARFEREVELTSSLRHPHLVTVFDSGEAADGAQWFAMEFVEGRPFVRWAREGRLRPERELLGCFVLLCRAVDAAHRRGVIHRDLKSSNVLVDTNGEPHVLDFGLAASRLVEGGDAEERLTRTGEFMGTLAYASPEHVSGDPRRVDVRSDVYSLGVLVYEALCGRLPRDVQGSTLAVAQRIVGLDIDRRPLARLPLDLATIVATALAQDPERRYATAGAFADDVERYLTGRAIDARRDSAAYVVRKALERHRGKVLAAAAALAATIGFAVVSASLWRRSEANRALAVVEADRANELGGFWQSLFDALDPQRVEGRRFDVREVLDLAAARMAERPPRSAAAELALSVSLGRTYHKLGRDEQAWPFLARAAELGRATRPAGDPTTAGIGADAAVVALIAAPLEDARRIVASLDGLAIPGYTRAYIDAQLAFREGDSARAFQRLDEGLALLAAPDSPPDQLGAVAILLEMARLAFARGDYAAAERLSRDAIPLAERVGGPESNLALFARYELARALEVGSDPGQALEAIEAAADAFARRYGPSDALAVSTRASALIVRGRLQGFDTVSAAAEELFGRADHLATEGSTAAVNGLEALRELARGLGDLGRASALSDACQSALTGLPAADVALRADIFAGAAQVSLEARRFDDVLVEATESIELLEDGLHGSAAVLTRARSARAMALAHLGRLSEAAADATAARALAVTAGDAGQKRAETARALAFVQSLSGELAAAEATLREALAELGRRAGTGGATEAWLRGDLGDVLLQRLEPAAAEPELRAALTIARARLGARHPDTADIANKLGTALFYQQKGPPELPGLWHDALEALRGLPVELPAYASVLNNLGAWAQVVDGDLARAEEHFRSGLAVAERVHGPGHPLLAPSLANVAAFDLRDGDLGAAKGRLERALAIMLATYGEAHPRVAQLRQLLAQCEPAAGSAR